MVDGIIRERSAHIADVDAQALSPAGLARLAALAQENLPDDKVMLPRGAEKGDWDVELGVVIGTRARYVEEAEALSFVAGYSVVNDISERSCQFERSGTWDKGNGCDTFGPVGPYLVTADEVGDPQELDLWLGAFALPFQPEERSFGFACRTRKAEHC